MLRWEISKNCVGRGVHGRWPQVKENICHARLWFIAEVIHDLPFILGTTENLKEDMVLSRTWRSGEQYVEYLAISEDKVTGLLFKEREGYKECQLPAFVESACISIHCVSTLPHLFCRVSTNLEDYDATIVA